MKTKFLYHNVIEWELITEHYGNRTAKRSSVPLISHIKEGIEILDRINASVYAKRAFMIHPLVQADIDLKNNLQKVISNVDVMVVALALEYRNIANAFLSDKLEFIINNNILDKSEIKLSPLKDVNDMLIADKVQNKKDFELYLRGRKDVPNSDTLDIYFKMWLDRLDISNDKYLELVKNL